MYLPDHSAGRELDVLHGWLPRFPFALQVTAADGGFAGTLLPLWLDAAAGPRGTLYSHEARAKAHGRGFDGAARALAVFSGPRQAQGGAYAREVAALLRGLA
jgi:transcriptional regulator